MQFTSRIDKVDKNHYRIVVNLGHDPTDRRYKKKQKDVHGTKAEAELVLQSWIEELQQAPKTLSSQTIGQFLMHWVDTIAKPELERNTYDSYRWELEKHIVPSLGHIPLCEIAPIHVQTFYSYKAEAGRLDGKGGLSNRTITYHHAILNQALASAKVLKLIEENPCDVVKPPRDKRNASEKIGVVLTKDELGSVLIRLRGHRDYALIYAAAFTGMRQSELLGLQWDDILWDTKQIRVRKAMHRHRSGEYEHRARTKNKTSSRIIKVTDDLMVVLREHRKEQMQALLAAGSDRSSNLVFPDLDGSPQNRLNVYHRFRNIITKLGHKGMRFHDLRHTHATILLASGVMINVVSKRLGHANVDTTLGIYAHVLPEFENNAADTFADLVVTKATEAASKTY